MKFWILLVLLISGPQLLFAKGAACGPVVTDVRDPFIRSLMKENRLQEAAWMLVRHGQRDFADILKASIEYSLKNSKVISSRVFDGGITETHMVTFEDGLRAVFKPDPKYWRSKKESEYHANVKAEVKAYEFDQVLELNIVPVTVEREIRGKWGSVQIFVVGDESRINGGYDKKTLFQYLINDTDRSNRNYFPFKNQIVSIDHGAGFGLQGYSMKNELGWAEVHPSHRRFYNNLLNILTPKKIEEMLMDLPSDRLLITSQMIQRRKNLLRKMKLFFDTYK